jgi:dihydroorotase
MKGKSMSTLTEEETFKQWLEAEKEKGLADIKLYPNNPATASKEDIYAELNAMNHAIEQGRYELVKDL